MTRELRYKESEKRGTSTSNDDPDRWHRIRCPKCKWQPGRDDRWMCSCLHVWNTFDTLGTCPRCSQIWRETQCLRCQGWSLHADWYASD